MFQKYFKKNCEQICLEIVRNLADKLSEKIVRKQLSQKFGRMKTLAGILKICQKFIVINGYLNLCNIKKNELCRYNRHPHIHH